MKRLTTFIAALLLLSSLWPTVTVAQQIQMPPSTVFCNLGTKTQPGYACPLTNFFNYIVQYLGPFFGVDQNILNKQTANYTVASTDCGKTVEMGTGSTGFLTVTIPAVTGFPGTCSVKIINGDTTNGKAISGLTGVPGNMLWPGQAATVKIINGGWYWTEKPGAWVLTSSLTFNVDPVNGCAPTAVPTCDGLGTGADAFNTVQRAIDFSLQQINFNGKSGTVLLVDGTYTEQVSCTGKFIGTTEITIQGAAGHTASVAWNVALTGSGDGFFIKDYCALWLDNMTINVANSANGIVTTLFGNVDVGAGVSCGSAAVAQGTTGTCISIGSSGFGSAVGNFSVNGSFNWAVLNQGGSWTFSGRAITGASGLTFASAFLGGTFNGQTNLSSATFPGFSGISGYKFRMSLGAVLQSNGVDPNTILPGSANGIGSAANFDGGAYSLAFPTFSIPIDNVNCNVTGDAAILTVPSPSANWSIIKFDAQGVSGTFTTAKAGINSLASGGGVALVSQTGLSGITSAAINTSGNATQLTGGGSPTVWNYQTIYLNIGTAQGGTCVANFYLQIVPRP
jgi:hypothetical protein